MHHGADVTNSNTSFLKITATTKFKKNQKWKKKKKKGKLKDVMRAYASFRR